MNDINEHIKLANALSGNLKQLISKQNKAIAKLPVDHQEKIKPYQKDIAQAMKTLKNGDLTELQKIIDRHAGTNNR